MATFSDMVINLFLNSKDAEQGLVSFQKQVESSVGSIRNVILGVLGARGILGMYNQMQRLATLSERFNLPIEKVSAFANTFAVFGGNVDGAADTIEKFQQMANSLRFHSSGPLRELSAIIGENLYGQDYMGIIQALRRQWSTLNKDARTEILNMQCIGHIVLQRMLNASDAELEAAVKRGEQFGVMTTETADSLTELQRIASETQQALFMAVQPLVDVLKPVLEIVRDVVLEFNRLDPTIRRIIAGLIIGIPLLRGLGGVLSMFGGAGNGIAGTLAKGWFIWDGLTGIWDFAKGMREVIHDGRELESMLNELASKHWTMKIAIEVGSALGEWLGNFKSDVKAADAGIRALFGIADSKDYAAIYSYAERRSDADLMQYARQGMAAEFWDNLSPEARQMAMPYTPTPAAARTDAWGGMSTTRSSQTQIDNSNSNQTINIYGVTGAEDMMSRLRSLATQGITPTIGYR